MGVSVAVLLLLEKVMLAITADVRPAHNYVVTMLIICTKVQQQKKKKYKKKPLAKERNRKILNQNLFTCELFAFVFLPTIIILWKFSSI